MKAGALFLCVVVALIASIVGTFGVLWLRAAWPAHPNDTFAILLTGLLAAFVGTIAVAAAIWGTISARKIARSQTTLDHIASMEADASYQRAKQGFAIIVRANIDISRYASSSKEGDPATQAIATVLNEYELVSIGIQRGIIDPELYKRWAYSTVIFDWESAAPFVVELRRRTGRKSLYHEFEELARWMSQDRLPHRSFWWAGV